MTTLTPRYSKQNLSSIRIGRKGKGKSKAKRPELTRKQLNYFGNDSQADDLRRIRSLLDRALIERDKGKFTLQIGDMLVITRRLIQSL